MALSSGTKLGPYEIQSLVGAGGMGEVYRARDARLDRTVAIKVLPPSFSADRDRMQRFALEARAAAGLNHPNILSIFDIGDEHGSPYVVSELLEGETLRERLRSGALSIRKTIDNGLQVARGLAAAHEKGIVHRDLKPENLFITSDGRVKILDFGLAKLTRPEAESGADAPTVHAVTEPGLIMGTAGYMSPEQVRGQVADPRSDIFAFGAILFEMISGKRAFHGETSADTMSAILKEDVPELSETARNVPAGLERIVRHCLEKNPSQRFHSAGDLAFDLEALTEISAGSSKSGAQAAVAHVRGEESRRKLLSIAGAVVVAAALIGLGWWLGHGRGGASSPEYQQITFRTGSIGNARFTPDGSIVYDASWEGGPHQLFLARTDDNGSRELGMKDSALLSISRSGELAILINSVYHGGYARVGTLARVPLSGGTPREVLENVQDADWAADGENMAVVRFVPENSHWRLEYPVGKVLFDSINWISHPKISPDGKRVAFSDHENPSGDDEGSVAVIEPDGHEKKLSTGWSSVEGVLWSPAGDEIWFTASDSGNAANLRGVTLAGKVRTIINVPGGMWLQDARGPLTLMITHQARLGIRALPPGGKEELELGWFGWSLPRDISRDGKKVLFEEEAEGGGPNYTVFLRDTDGSPPVRIGDGTGEAISPDSKWVITKPAKGGALSLVPTGAGEARQLTHDKISYGSVRYLPDGKQVLASGIEAGHGARDYLIDLSNGNAKPVTPEGTAGTQLSPDGRSVAAIGPDGKWGIWPLDGSSLRPIPGLDSNYYVSGWTPDGTSLYALSNQRREGAAKVYRVDPTTGKMDYWKTFGENLPAGVASVGGPHFSADGSAYAYVYSQVLSQAYVVKGLK
ncbi:MAG TPA: protein kinase [Terriglobales bacterium]|jgi:tRNA A-37 threonylcarbamoyl transferase component Bud32/Tol biopolymer transport system component|nr:protein kinase [Terriglobales bacterium]